MAISIELGYSNKKRASALMFQDIVFFAMWKNQFHILKLIQISNAYSISNIIAFYLHESMSSEQSASTLIKNSTCTSHYILNGQKKAIDCIRKNIRCTSQSWQNCSIAFHLLPFVDFGSCSVLMITLFAIVQRKKGEKKHACTLHNACDAMHYNLNARSNTSCTCLQLIKRLTELLVSINWSTGSMQCESGQAFIYFSFHMEIPFCRHFSRTPLYCVHSHVCNALYENAINAPNDKVIKLQLFCTINHLPCQILSALMQLHTLNTEWLSWCFQFYPHPIHRYTKSIGLHDLQNR